MVDWILLAVRFAFVSLAIIGTVAGIRQAGRSPTGYLTFMGVLMVGTMIFISLIYDHFRLWHWLFG